MLLQAPPNPLWQANYKSMSAAQLVTELQRMAKNPHHYDACARRKAFIVDELVLRDHRPTRPIILMEADQARETNMGLTIVDGPTIALGESLSDGVDCTGGTIVRITVPKEYTPANMTFQSSSNGDLYNDLYDATGDEVTMVAKPDTTIIIEAPWARSLGFIKFRSGTRSAPVLQTKDTVLFGVALETRDAGTDA